jgi:heme oxygenase
VSPGLPARLRSETQALHHQAESTATLRSLLQGRMNQAAYVRLLSNLLAIYSALEPAMQRHAAHPVLAPIYFPALHRVASLQADLAAFHVGDSATTEAVVPATLDYVKRIEMLDAHTPQLLAAHAYVRYLGDLSGGQVLKRIVSQNSHLHTRPVPVSFYDFGDATTTASLAASFRAGLASIVLSQPDEDALVAEAKHAFELHITLFDQLSLRAEAPGAA